MALLAARALPIPAMTGVLLAFTVLPAALVAVSLPVIRRCPDPSTEPAG